MNSIIETVKKWFTGVRVYIAIAAVLLTIVVLWWTSSVYGDSSLAAIRLQEIYAWISLSLILITVAIGPVCRLFKSLPGKGVLRDARRMLGISAAWFATLHVAIAYIDQFNAINPFKLPDNYQFAFLLGFIALLILLVMAFTSFDAAFRKLGKWWFRLHRLIYVAILLILIHSFNIGVHATTAPFLISLAFALGLLFAAHFYIAFRTDVNVTTLHSIVLCYGFLLTVGIFAYGLTQGARQITPVIMTDGDQYETR